MKVFISYSNHDRATAEALYRDLRAAGAAPFEFGQSATGDSAAFSEIIAWISTSDAFVALISAHSLASFPVQEEIRTANHRYINSRRTHPAQIISAVIEPGAEPPLDTERFSQIELVDYAAGRSTLFRQLGLSEPVVAPAAPAPALPDVELEKPAREYARSRPEDQTEWIARARETLARTPHEAEADHVDALLANLSSRLLPAPVARRKGNTLVWDAVPNATGYVVEQTGASAREVFRGPNTFFMVPPGAHIFAAASYRVKATGGLLGEDGPWSDRVDFAPSPSAGSPLPPALLRSPPPPSLEISDDRFGKQLEWSAVDGATGYVLERQLKGLIRIADIWTSIYEGDATRHLDIRLESPDAPRLKYAYRVKAVGPWGVTAWSDQVAG
jgi:hypothetical protein